MPGRNHIKKTTAAQGHLDGSPVKVICVAAGLGDSVRELGEVSRDQVVMARIDEATSKDLDQWVQTGAVRSRSEAAALFIRGLMRETTTVDFELRRLQARGRYWTSCSMALLDARS